nr:MAG TPA: hypothetical protein [Caudoviricetes sp.]
MLCLNSFPVAPFPYRCLGHSTLFCKRPLASCTSDCFINRLRNHKTPLVINYYFSD